MNSQRKAHETEVPEQSEGEVGSTAVAVGLIPIPTCAPAILPEKEFTYGLVGKSAGVKGLCLIDLTRNHVKYLKQKS